MVILDADGRMVQVNTEAEKLFGYDQKELLGKKFDLLMPNTRGERNVKRVRGQGAQIQDSSVWSWSGIAGPPS
jgi:PAS domain S-box-containing protein